MPFPCHAVPLSVHIVSFPFVFYSAAVFDSHMLSRTHATPVPCHSESDFSRPRHSAEWERHGLGMVCMYCHRPSRDGMWATCPLSVSSGYHAEFHETCYQKHTRTNPLNCITICSNIFGYHADLHE
jgi:hypothetical protein